MSRATVTSGMKRTVKSVQAGMEKTMARSGIETDKDVMLYNNLTRDDFSDLANLYGNDDIMFYIRSMESKRLFK